MDLYLLMRFEVTGVKVKVIEANNRFLRWLLTHRLTKRIIGEHPSVSLIFLLISATIASLCIEVKLHRCVAKLLDYDRRTH